MKRKLNLNAKTYTLSAMILGYLMIGDYDYYMQNAIGNWFLIIGQILEGNAAIEQAIQYENKNVNKYKDFNNIIPSKEELNDIESILNDMLNKIDKIKKGN